MKYLILAVLFIPSISLAENWLKFSEIADPSKTIWTSKELCEASGAACGRIDGLDGDVIAIEETAGVRKFVEDPALKAAKASSLSALKVEEDRKAGVRVTRKARLIVLAQKVKAGTITATERSELIGLMILDRVRELGQDMD